MMGLSVGGPSQPCYVVDDKRGKYARGEEHEGRLAQAVQ